tara:strand:+ start:42 stop:473 length:432 start_codon:yes stop_codon:yes gene_type:complete
MKIKLHRYSQDKNQSMSVITVLNNLNKPLFSSIGIERGWRNNEKNVSCIPKGTYNVVLEYSNRFKQDLWEIKGVRNRSETKFHAANFWNQLNGCIALGVKPRDINKDGYLDVTESRKTMTNFHNALKGETKVSLIITSEINVF